MASARSRCCKRLLLRRQRVLPLAPAQLFRRWPHGLDGFRHFIGELLERRIGPKQLAALHALGQRLRLIAQLGLHVGQKLGVLLLRPPRLFGGFLIWFQVAAMISFWRSETCGVLLAAAATAAHLLRLRVLALEGLRLDEEHVAAAGGQRVARGGVHAHDVARDELEIFQVERGRALGRFLPFVPPQRDRLLRRRR